MKRIFLLAIIAASMLLAAACGSPAPVAAQPASTRSSASTDGTEVDITLADNTIKSSLTSFKVGVPYAFVITNNGHRVHDFNISQPVSVVGSLDAALQTALLVVPQEKLNPGAKLTVQFTFPDSAASLQLGFSCLIEKHYNDGMRLAITVTK